VHNIVTGAGIDKLHAQWIFSVTDTDAAASHPMEQYYPGDAFVDWLMVDGLNGSSRTPSAIFTNMLGRFTTLSASKPQAAFDGTVLDPDIAGKNAWIAAAYSLFQTRS
jgi:hypothetical protein